MITSLQLKPALPSSCNKQQNGFFRAQPAHGLGRLYSYVLSQDTSIRNLRLRNLAERYVFRAAGTASISAHKKNLLNLLRNFAMQPVLVRDAAPSSFQSQHQMESYRVSSELKVRIEP